MPRWKSALVRRSELNRLIVGAVGGCLILGVGGRSAMALVSLVTPLPLNLTLRGSLAVVVTGGIYGLVGAGLDWMVYRPLEGRPVARTLTVSLVLFMLIGLVSAALNQMSAAWLYPALTVACFLPLTLGFAALLAARLP